MEFLKAIQRQKWHIAQGFSLTFLLALLCFALEIQYLGWLAVSSLIVTFGFIIAIAWCPLADVKD